MTSDFFLEEADQWREEAWDIMRQRPDVKFFLLTKRPQRVKNCLPKDWGSGWDNVFFNVTCENQRRADERIPILLELPFKHKGIMCAPFIGPISVGKYLPSRYVIHTVGPIVNGPLRDKHRELLESCYHTCLKLADENGFESIAFCCISTGEFHFPNEEAAPIAIREAQNYRKTGGACKVVFNVFIRQIDKGQAEMPAPFYFEKQLHLKLCQFIVVN